MSKMLFTPLELGGVTLANRIVVSPMCQYSADHGNATDWHLQHLGGLSLSGAGLLMIEATHVEAVGRITHACLGLYSDANEAALGRVLAAVRGFGGAARIGIQLAHAGRKGSAQRPWLGGRALMPEEGAWPTVAPSAIPFGEEWPTPRTLSLDEIGGIKNAFIEAARRAVRLGIEVIELHAAHGYLLHSFFSPLSNHRDDQYGGNLERRMRLPLEVAAAVRAILPRGRALGMRISGSDWIEGGATIEDAIVLARELRTVGIDYVCVSSGGLEPRAKIPVAPGYQAPFAHRVRVGAGIPTCAVGMIVDPLQAEAIAASGQADMVALARAFLDNPRWVWRAADLLGAEVPYPPQYARASPRAWPGARLIHIAGTMAASEAG